MNIRRPKICRICRAPDNDDLISVQLVQDSLTIAQMVGEVTGIEVTADKNLPQNICLRCLERLRSAFQLRQQCIESDRLLRREIYPEDPKGLEETGSKNEEPPDMMKLEIEALDETASEAEVEEENEEANPTTDNEMLISNDTESNAERIDLKIILEDVEEESLVEQAIEYEDTKLAAAQELIDILAPHEDIDDGGRPGILYLKNYAETDYEVLLQKDHYEQIRFVTAGCCGCSERFQHEEDLLDHGVLVHQKDGTSAFNPDQPYECPICFRQFPNAEAVEQHRSHMDTDCYHCRECDILLDSKIQMLQHLERSHAISVDDDEEDEEYSEVEDDDAGEHAPSLTLAAFRKDQYRLISTENDYDLMEFAWFGCCGCEDLFETREEFEAHSKQLHLPDRIEQHEQKPIECSICYERFDKKSLLMFHRNRPNKRRVVCRICEGIFNSEMYLRKHMAQNHGISLENKATSLQPVSVESMEVDTDDRVAGTSDTYSIHEIEYIEELPEEMSFQEPSDDEELDSGDDEDLDAGDIKGENKYAATRQRKELAFIPGDFIRVISEHDGYNIVKITKERCCCCLKFFDPLDKMNEHMEKHQVESLTEELLPSKKRPIIYECEYCLKKFDIAMLYVIHKRIREQKQFYQCRLCDFVIDSESRLKNHMLYNDQHAKFFNLIREDVSDRYDTVQLPGFRCCGCGLYFEDESALADHSREYHPRDPKKDAQKRKQMCSICDRRFHISSEVSTHQQKKGSTVRYYCKLCEFECAIQARMLKHLYSAIHNQSLPSIKVKPVEIGYQKPGSVRYCCFEDCNLPFHDVIRLQEHVEEMHRRERDANLATAVAATEGEESSTSNRWQCDCCCRMFRTVTALKQHQLATHRVPKSFVCTVCGEAKSNKTALTVHEMKHTGERPFGCNLCDKRFTSRTILNSHLKCHFPKQYQCTECGEKFARSENLKRHIRHRHAEASVCCSYCPRKLKTREAAILHERSHTGEKPFQCRTDGCDKRYASITDRRRHEMANHTGERPHKCTDCDASFVRKRQLTIHERKHTGERPFACVQCGKAFVDARLLKKHTC